MSLEITLYKYKNRENVLKVRKQYQKEAASVWEAYGEYDSLSEKQKYQADLECKLLRETLRIDADGCLIENYEKISIDSKIYPEHLFKIGSIVSFHNSRGLNNFLNRTLGEDLNSAFNAELDDLNESRPDWAKARIVIEDFILRLKAKCIDNVFYDAFELRTASLLLPDEPSEVNSINKALAVFHEEFAKYHKNIAAGSTAHAFSTREGEFYFDRPLKVHSFIVGEQSKSMMNEDGKSVYVIYDHDISWYLQALEIIIEMFDYILEEESLDETIQFYLRWHT